MLVNGDTIVGRTLALLLRRAGYDPLFVTGQGQSPESRVTFLCPAAYRVLDALGAGDHLRANSVALERVAVQRPESRQDTATELSSNATTERAPAVLVRTQPLKRALEIPSPDGHPGHGRRVEAVSQTENGVAVEFEDGIREWFDIVVDASGADQPLRSESHTPPSYVPLRQYEAPTESEVTGGNRIRDNWYPNALVQYLPRPDSSGSVQRVTVPGSDSQAPSNRDAEPRHDPLAESDDKPAVHEQVTVRQTRLPIDDVERDWWRNGRVVFCGPSAYPVAPASGSRASFGIGDAVAFVSELTHETRSPTDIADAYATNRVDRFETLRETAAAARTDHRYPTSDTNQTSLDDLALFRTVALGSFLDTPLSPLQPTTVE